MQSRQAYIPAHYYYNILQGTIYRVAAHLLLRTWFKIISKIASYISPSFEILIIICCCIMSRKVFAGVAHAESGALACPARSLVKYVIYPKINKYCKNILNFF